MKIQLIQGSLSVPLFLCALWWKSGCHVDTGNFYRIPWKKGQPRLEKRGLIPQGLPRPTYTNCSAGTLRRSLCGLFSPRSHFHPVAPALPHSLSSNQMLSPLCPSFCLIVLLLSHPSFQTNLPATSACSLHARDWLSSLPPLVSISFFFF